MEIQEETIGWKNQFPTPDQTQKFINKASRMHLIGPIFVQTPEQIEPIYKVLTYVNSLCTQTTQSNTTRLHQLNKQKQSLIYKEQMAKENFVVTRQ